MRLRFFFKAPPRAGDNSVSHLLHKLDNRSSFPRIHLKAGAAEQVPVITGLSASVWETETEELLQALGVPTLACAKVNSERGLVMSKVEVRTSTLIVL